MIDSHTHLFLCERPRGRAGRRGARGGRRADAQRRPRRAKSNAAGDRRRRAPRGGLRRRRPPPDHGRPASTTRGGGDRGASAPTRRCGRSARPGSTTTATRAAPEDQRRAFEAQIEIARERGLPIVIHARDPEGETGAIDEVFEILDAAGRRGAGDPALLLAPWRVEDAAERGWYCSFAGNVTYPKAERAARGRGEACPTSCSWSRPTRPTWRRSRCAASRTSPPTWSPRREVVAEVRGVAYEELERTVEANARALFGW